MVPFNNQRRLRLWQLNSKANRKSWIDLKTAPPKKVPYCLLELFSSRYNETDCASGSDIALSYNSVSNFDSGLLCDTSEVCELYELFDWLALFDDVVGLFLVLI